MSQRSATWRFLWAITLICTSLLVVSTRPAAATACPCNIFGNATPTMDDGGPDFPIILGTQFHSDVDGYVTGVRFYKSVANTGLHVGKLWEFNNLNQYQMGGVTFTNETASGWQTATFAKPIYIMANHSYIITYDTQVGHFAYDDHYFDSLPSSGPLHVDEPGSRYGYNLMAGPTPTGTHPNYWVDPVFSQQIAVTSLLNMTHAVPEHPDQGDPSDAELGTRFTSDINTHVIGIRYWAGESPWYNPRYVHLWDSNGNLLATDAYPDRDYPSGWIETYFDTPVAISAGQEYVASYLGNNYGYTTNYFAAPYSNGPYHVPANGGVYHGGVVSAFPATTSPNGYWVEPIFSLDSSNDVSVSIDPSMTFSVGSHAGACNGVAQSAGVSSSATSVALGHISPSANLVAAQDLHVVTNAGSGYTVFGRYSGALGDGNGHSIADIGGTNASPGAFSSAGTAAFGYTTNDSALGTGTANRFTNGGAKWAAMTSSNAELSYASGAANKTACVAFQTGVSGLTPAGSYTTTVIYTAVPQF